MPYLTKEQGSGIVKLLVAGMLCFLLMVGYVFWQSYQGRSDVVDNNRHSCEGGKKAVQALLVVNQSVYDAFKDTDERLGGPISAKRKKAEKDLKDSLPILKKRAHRNCVKENPKAGLIP